MTIDDQSPPGAWKREISHAPWAYKPIFIDATQGTADPNARGGVRRYLDTVKPEEYKPNTGEVDLTELSLTGLADLYGSDKGTIKHNYTVQYERIVNELLRQTPRKIALFIICEAGVACGASLRMWGNYLPASKIIGYDIRPECKELCKDMKNVTIRIEDLCKNKIGEYVDIFIDDASHISEEMVAMFNNCWSSVRSGGYYIIEDLGCTYNRAYTEQFREHFNENAINSRDAVVKFMDDIMKNTDSKQGIAEIRYYPQLLVIKKA